MKTSLVMSALVLGMISCAGQGAGPKAGQAAPNGATSPSPQRTAWRVYQRVTRGESIQLSEIERDLGPGAPVSPSRADRQWSFKDTDDFLVVTLDAQGRSTGAFWGLAHGGHSGQSQTTPSAAVR